MIPIEQGEWSSFFRGAQQLILVLDRDQRVLKINEAALKALGISESDAVGKKCYELFHQADQPPYACPALRMLREGASDTTEMEVEALNATFIVSCTPILDENGQLIRILHTAIDITEQKERNGR